MMRLLVVILVVIAGVAAVGYSRGWFNVTNEGQVEVQVDQAKVQEDKAAFSKAVGEKAQAIKDQVASLWEKTEALSGEEKTHAQKELGDLKIKHDRLERQIKELEDASQNKFESIKQDLSNTLEEVEKKIEELKANLE